MGYLKHTIRGLSWMGAFRVVTRSLTFVRIIILARLLDPKQFGIFGIAVLVLSFLEIFTETGINIFLIQEQENLDTYVDTAWLVSIVRGVLIASLIILLSYSISVFFKSPESLTILRLIALIPFVRGFINPSEIKFLKDLKFNKEFTLRTLITLTETLGAIGLSFYFRSALGLVFGMLMGAIIEVIISQVFITPRPRLAFQGLLASKIIKRGRWMTAAGIFNYFFQNGDNITVGRLMNTYSLGIYQMAYSISILPITEIASTLGQVTFPIYTRIAGDRNRLKNAYLKTTLGIVALVLPFCLVLALFPAFLVHLFLGDKWQEVASVLPVLAVFGSLRAITGFSAALFFAVKHQEYVTVINLFSMLGLGLTIVPFVWYHGILGASYSALIGSITGIPFIAAYLYKVFKHEQAS